MSAEKDYMEMFGCMGCGVCTIDEYYMVHNHIWESALLPSDADSKYEMLCIACLESRLNRELHKEDFTNAPVNSMNDWKEKSFRLCKRLTTPKPASMHQPNIDLNNLHWN